MAKGKGLMEFESVVGTINMNGKLSRAAFSSTSSGEGATLKHKVNIASLAHPVEFTLIGEDVWKELIEFLVQVDGMEGERKAKKKKEKPAEPAPIG